MHIIYAITIIIAGFIWGDWKNWKVYYPTILFFIIGDLLSNFLLVNKPMWIFKETILFEEVLVNHTIITLVVMFAIYPFTVILFLGRFPQKILYQVLWVTFWTALYITAEYLNLKVFNLITHHNGWNIWWSLIFTIIMFLLLKLHLHKPLLTWIFSFIWIIFLINAFELPIEQLR